MFKRLSTEHRNSLSPNEVSVSPSKLHGTRVLVQKEITQEVTSFLSHS